MTQPPDGFGPPLGAPHQGGPATPPGFQPPTHLQDDFAGGRPLAAARRPLANTQRLLALAVVAVLLIVGTTVATRVFGSVAERAATLDGSSGTVLEPFLPDDPAVEVSATAPPARRPSRGPVPKPVRYTGSGSKTLRIRTPEPGIALLYVKGNAARERFFITQVKSNGVRGAVILAEFGAYEGVQVLDGQPAWGLRVEATGPWTIELRSPRSAPSFSRAAQGSRAGVFWYTGRGGVATLTGGSREPGGALTVLSHRVDGGPGGLIALLIDRKTERVDWPAGPLLVEFDTGAPWSVRVG